MESTKASADFDPEPSSAAPPEEIDRSWLVLLHLSEYLGYLVPFAGFVAPVFIWLVMKDESPEMDRHGRNVVNWIITSTVYLIIAVVLSLGLIGIPFFILIWVLVLIFPLVGAVKASKGVAWKYPMTIRFF